MIITRSGVLIRLPVSGDLAARARDPGRAPDSARGRRRGGGRGARGARRRAAARASATEDAVGGRAATTTKPAATRVETPRGRAGEPEVRRAWHREPAVSGVRASGTDERARPALYMDRASASTVARLSSYYRILGEFEREHLETIASKRLAERAGVTSAQVRKDLSLFGNFGRRGLGYNVAQLREQIGAILGLGRRWRVALIGAGNLGHALFSYREFQKQGFQIEDDASTPIQRRSVQAWDGVAIVHIAELPQLRRDPGIDIAIVAVPVHGGAARSWIAAVKAGIRGLLNFAPGKLAIPDGVAMRDVDLSIAMESLSYALVK